MKTAISVPDALFEAAERLIRRSGRSRSEFYSRALREYVARHDPERVTAAINAVVADVSDDGLDFVDAAGRATLERVEW
jgi:metal-responsive CopG/Arc/MetJ family transcriptional regulator